MPDPSRSVLAFLCADRFPVERKKRGIPVPCADAAVGKGSLAVLVYAFALWGLRDQGIVELRAVESERRLRSDVLRVRPTLIEPAPPGPENLEWAIATRLGGEQNFDDVRGMLARSGWNHLDPWLHVVRVVIADAHRAGLGELVVPPIYKRMRGPEVLLEPDCDSIRELGPALDELVDAWDRFGAEDPTLRGALLADCQAGFTQRFQPAP